MSGRCGCLQTHVGDYSSLTAAAEAIAKQVGAGKETLHRWAAQAQIDGGTRSGVTSVGVAEIKKLKAENRLLLREGATGNRLNKLASLLKY